MALQVDGLLPATLALLEALAGNESSGGWFGGGAAAKPPACCPQELVLVQAAPIGARHYFVRNNAVKCRVQKPATTLSSFLAPLLKALGSASQTVTAIERSKSGASSAGPQCMTAPQFRSWLGTFELWLGSSAGEHDPSAAVKCGEVTPARMCTQNACAV